MDFFNFQPHQPLFSDETLLRDSIVDLYNAQAKMRDDLISTNNQLAEALTVANQAIDLLRQRINMLNESLEDLAEQNKTLASRIRRLEGR